MPNTRIACCLWLAAVLSSGSSVAAPPNVVLIIGDDQGWGDYGFMGHPAIQTPRLDRLASEGLLFTRGYVPSSLCRPSLATIITGLFAHQHKITSNDPPWPKGLEGKPGAAAKDPAYRAGRQEMIAYIEQVPTLPRLLAQEGYVSFQSGKWWEGSYRRGGFSAGMTHGDPARGGRHGDAGLTIGREGMQPVLDFIDRAAGKPFFLWYAPMLPHQPHDPPERLLAKYKPKTDSIHLARYWAMCEWFDETCGQLLDHLERKGLAANTLVVYVADNGWIQEPNRPTSDPKSKRSPYDGGLRTPIVLRWPGRIAPKRDTETLASSVDLAPTILAACGLRRTAQMQGINLLDADALTRRQAIFGEVFTHNAVDIHQPARNLQYRWCIDGWWKLIVPNPANVPDAQPELYDLRSDPKETHNLAAGQPARVDAMRTQIDRWWAAP